MFEFNVIQEVAPQVHGRFGIVQEVTPISMTQFDIIQGVGLYAIIGKFIVVEEVEQEASVSVISRTRN